MHATPKRRERWKGWRDPYLPPFKAWASFEEHVSSGLIFAVSIGAVGSQL